MVFVPSEPSFELYTTPEASSGYPGAVSPPTYPESMHTTQAPLRFSASAHALNGNGS
ncbi:hypothetical protein [Streptomyces griseofuscus]|uniref:hypothetical protein n=1 Tax=Streptomyces griseofuscus TaxID=146922 RepID=UPI003720C567